MKAVSATLVNPGFGLGFQQIDPNNLSQVWSVTFENLFRGEVRVSPTEAMLHKDIVQMILEIAEHVYARGGEKAFPYSTNDLKLDLEFKSR